MERLAASNTLRSFAAELELDLEFSFLDFGIDLFDDQVEGLAGEIKHAGLVDLHLSEPVLVNKGRGFEAAQDINLAEPLSRRFGLPDLGIERRDLTYDGSLDRQVLLPLLDDIQVGLHPLQRLLQSIDLAAAERQLAFLTLRHEVFALEQILVLVPGRLEILLRNQAVFVEFFVAFIESFRLLQLILELGQLLVQLKLELLHGQAGVAEVVALMKELGLAPHDVHQEVGIAELEDGVPFFYNRADLDVDLLHAPAFDGIPVHRRHGLDRAFNRQVIVKRPQFDLGDGDVAERDFDLRFAIDTGLKKIHRQEDDQRDAARDFDDFEQAPFLLRPPKLNFLFYGCSAPVFK